MIEENNKDKESFHPINDNNFDLIKDIVHSISILKDVSNKVLSEIVKDTELISFKIGQPISSQEIIPNKIFFILDGYARLIYNDKNKSSTLLKLSKGSFIGLGSLLRIAGCETVIASSELKVLSFTDESIFNLYSNDQTFRLWCQANIQPCEILKLTELLIEKSIRTDINIKTAYNVLSKSLILTKGQIEKDSKDEVLIVGSDNIKNKTIGDIIKSNEIHIYDETLAPRIFKLSNSVYNEFMKKNIINQSIEDDKWQEKIINFNEGKSPDKSSLEFITNKKDKKLTLIKGKGELKEALSCLQMIADQLDVPFRKDSIEKVLRDIVRNGSKITLDTFGQLTSSMGLYSAKARIPRHLAGRLPTPSLLIFDKKICLLYKSSSENLSIASPSNGLITIKSSDFTNLLPEFIELIVVEKSTMTPNKKFDLNWFVPSLKKYQGSLILVLIASFIVQLFGLANPLLIQVIIDKVISQRSLDTLQILGFALVVVTILGGVLGSLRTFMFAETTNRIDTRLGAEVIDHLLRLPLKYFDKRPVGELGSRVSELEKIREFLTGQALTTALDSVFSVIYIVVMFLYSSLLSFVALSVVPIQILLTLLGSPLLRRQIREIAKQNASTQSHLVEVLTGVQTVKAQNIETISRWKWQELYGGYISRTFEKTITSTALNQTSNVLQQLSQLLVLWIGAGLVLKGQLTLGQLIAFRIISSYVTQPLLRLSSIWQSVQELKVSFERLADIIDTQEESNESDKANIPLPQIQGQIKFEDVSFTFQKGTPDIIKNIDLEINEGSFVGIAGQSGSGKSTLMKLLPRLYNINRGRILIDNFDISKTELYSLRRQIGIVPQEPLLFSGSVSDNISVVSPEATSDEIIRAAKLAAAHEFIMELPEGYSTKVGERGGGLSGGQKQRIAIARTLINRPKLLILDEATSALDYQTEKEVCENLRLAITNSTVFFITHRLSTIKNADTIIMMHEGRVVEIGSHDQLISQKGRYYALYRQQEGS